MKQPIETLQAADDDQELKFNQNENGDDNSSSQDFASPFPVSNTQLSHVAGNTSIIIKEIQAISPTNA